MRERDSRPQLVDQDEQAELADVEEYFTSFYKSTVSGTPQDRHTIPGITEAESRFHYNVTENSIIRALISYEPLPKQAQLWHMIQERKAWNVLDIGTGTGHWVDFYLDVFFAKNVTGVEIVSEMVEFLKSKYEKQEHVNIIHGDISDSSFSISDTFDIVNAIGVMFHIVDDNKWVNAMEKLTALTKPGGLLVMGGEFGDVTGNVQFHKQDKFESWNEHDALDKEDIIVNKRIRSLKDWKDLAKHCSLEVIDLVRSDKDDAFETPENDVLLLKKPE